MNFQDLKNLKSSKTTPAYQSYRQAVMKSYTDACNEYNHQGNLSFEYPYATSTAYSSHIPFNIVQEILFDLYEIPKENVTHMYTSGHPMNGGEKHMIVININ